MPPKFGANLGTDNDAATGNADNFGADSNVHISTTSSLNTPDQTTATTPATPNSTSINNLDMNSATPPAGTTPSNGILASSPDDHPAYTKASGSGDIVINNNPQSQSSKKTFIIAGVIGLIVIILITILAILLSNSNKPTFSATAAEGKFNQYANYILYGETGDTLEGEYDKYGSYKLSQEFYSDEYNEEFWQTAEEKLSQAVEEYEKVDNPNQPILDFLHNYKNGFAFIKKYRQVQEDEPTAEQIVSVYINSGQTAAEQKINDFYQPLIEQPTGYVEEFLTARQNQYHSYVQYIAIHNQYGCIVDGGLIDFCTNMSEEDEQEVARLSESASESKNIADIAMERLLDSLISSCWVIDEQYSNPMDEFIIEEDISE